MSPYENRLNAENFRRVALIAEVSNDRLSALQELLNSQPADLRARCAESGIGHLHLYLQSFDARNVLFIYLEMDELDQEKAVQTFKSSHTWWAELEPHLSAHPRVSAGNAPWQRAEFINVIADNTDRDRNIGQPAGLAAGLHPDKELWYRTLHQTNWPGVIDQMARSHYQNWTTFMLEFGDELMLFTHVEYLGSDQSADDALMQADPVTQRWWQHTEPCLFPLIANGDNWSAMIRC
jgi:L-rhamnose mutarotase